jgi:hypothetical protein
MAAIKAMIADTMYPLRAPTSDLPHAGRQQIGSHEHRREAEHYEQVELHRYSQYPPAPINAASTPRERVSSGTE